MEDPLVPRVEGCFYPQGERLFVPSCIFPSHHLQTSHFSAAVARAASAAFTASFSSTRLFRVSSSLFSSWLCDECPRRSANRLSSCLFSSTSLLSSANYSVNIITVYRFLRHLQGEKVYISVKTSLTINNWGDLREESMTSQSRQALHGPLRGSKGDNKKIDSGSGCRRVQKEKTRQTWKMGKLTTSKIEQKNKQKHGHTRELENSTDSEILRNTWVNELRYNTVQTGKATSTTMLHSTPTAKQRFHRCYRIPGTVQHIRYTFLYLFRGRRQSPDRLRHGAKTLFVRAELPGR